MPSTSDGEARRDAPAARDIDLTWVEKYVTYEQSPDGTLQVTDHHFLAEVCYRDPVQLAGRTATLSTGEPPAVLATYRSDDPRTFTNGFYYTRKSKSYDSLAALERAHPSTGCYVWELQGADVRRTLAPIRIGGPEGRTAIPEPSPIFLAQRGSPVTPQGGIDHDEPLMISWRPFRSGVRREETQWQDLIFVLVSDREGRVVYTGGAPGAAGGFLDFTKTSTVVPAGVLAARTGYVAFISCVKYVDYNVSLGIEQLACNSFAVELPIATRGGDGPAPCGRRRASYLWGGKTPPHLGMVTWPGFLQAPPA